MSEKRIAKRVGMRDEDDCGGWGGDRSCTEVRLHVAFVLKASVVSSSLRSSLSLTFPLALLANPFLVTSLRFTSLRFAPRTQLRRQLHHPLARLPQR